MSLTHYITKARFSIWMSKIIWPLFWYCNTKLMICWPNFVTLFKLFQTNNFQQSNCHHAAPFSSLRIGVFLSLKGPGNGDFPELTCVSHVYQYFRSWHCYLTAFVYHDRSILGDPGAVRNLFRPCFVTSVATTVPGFPRMDRSQQSLWFSLQNIPLKTTTAFLIGLEQWCYCRAYLNSNILILEMVNVH